LKPQLVLIATMFYTHDILQKHRKFGTIWYCCVSGVANFAVLLTTLFVLKGTEVQKWTEVGKQLSSTRVIWLQNYKLHYSL